MSGSNHRRQQSSGTLSAEPDEPTQNDEEPTMTGTASRPRATRDRSLPATPRAHARVQPPPLSSSHRRVARYISSGWGEAPLDIGALHEARYTERPGNTDLADH